MNHIEEDESIVKPGMKEYHTGHLPKPQLPTIKGAADATSLPQKATFSMVRSVAPTPQQAYIWSPPVTKYTTQYSKVENYFTDLNKIAYPEEHDIY